MMMRRHIPWEDHAKLEKPLDESEAPGSDLYRECPFIGADEGRTCHQIKLSAATDVGNPRLSMLA